jgi:hypothetical protein
MTGRVLVECEAVAVGRDPKLAYEAFVLTGQGDERYCGETPPAC